LPANQAIELIVKAHVGVKATVGEQVTLTMAVQGTSLSPAEAAVTAVVDQATPSPSPTSPLPTFPGVTLPPGSTVTPANLSGLFPVVTPSSTPSPSASRRTRNRAATITPTASTLPLDPRLVGGQLAGLAVLAAAVTMVVARLSLRTPHPTAGAAATPPAGPATEDKQAT